MGSEISTLVGQYLRSEEFPHNLQRKVIRKFGKSVKGSEKEVLASLQAGDPSDPGRNEVKILSRLPPHVQRSAFLFLYEGALRQCSLVRAVSEAGCPEEECFQAFVEACSAFARHSVGAGTVVVAPSQDLDFLLVVRRGELVLRSPDLAGGATTLPAGACIEVGIRRPDLVFAGQQPPLQRANCTARAGQNGAIYSLATRAGVQAALRARPAAERAFLALRTSQIEAQRAQESEHERLVEAKREDERRRQQESLNERLIQAVDRGDVRAVRDLVLQGGEVNAVSDRTGTTALYAACLGQHRTLAEKLLEVGADVNKPSAHAQRTPLHAVSAAGWLPGVSLLCGRGADVSAADDAGRNPVHLAAAADHVEALHALVAAARESGREDALSAPDGGGMRPLALCVSQRARRVLSPKTRVGYSVLR